MYQRHLSAKKYTCMYEFCVLRAIEFTAAYTQFYAKHAHRFNVRVVTVEATFQVCEAMNKLIQIMK